MDKNESPARNFLNTLYYNSHSKSWLSLNHSLGEALHMAVGCGLRFDSGDFEYFMSRLKGDHWLNLEGTYASAVVAENTNACECLETHFGRPAFIWPGSRIYVGKEFEWPLASGSLEWLKCTGFSNEGRFLNACSYNPSLNPSEDDEPKRRLKSRYRITLNEIKEAREMMRGRTVREEWPEFYGQSVHHDNVRGILIPLRKSSKATASS